MQSVPLRGTDYLINYVTVNAWAWEVEWGVGGGFEEEEEEVDRKPPRLPTTTTTLLASRALFTPQHERETFHQPFCEHVLQHSCCSTFLWQRLFFLTSTQKLPSAQDSSFAFHRPGRRRTGRRKEGRRRRKWGKKRSWKRRHTHTHTQMPRGFR